ncbi:MAG: flagellar basal body rod protein FlgB [Gammaproteobacteria bacterium]|nr:flagellar basal body rod protein FlgB [Gammaproteobacteria bacterium]
MQFNFEKYLGLHEPALHLQSRRAQLLAANVANADTPKFKARDINFREVMKQAEENPKGQGPLRITSTQHFQPPGFTDGYEMLYRHPRQASIDGNTVEPEAEHSAFMENTMRYMSSLRFLSGKFNTLTTAIKGQ